MESQTDPGERWKDPLKPIEDQTDPGEQIL